jgi:hypothetical protein
MKGTLCIFLFLGSKLFSQSIDLKLDTLISQNIGLYSNQYTLRNSKQKNGEGWEIQKDKILNHIFYGETAENLFDYAGNWTVRNDSLIFFIKAKNLLKKYGHSSKESFKPCLLSLNLKTKTKNPADTSQVMVIKNRIAILTNGEDMNTLFMEIQTYLNSILEQEKSKLDSTLKWYNTELNENLRVRLGDYLFQKRLFSSVSSTRDFE